MNKHTPGPWKIGAPPPNGEQTIGTEAGMMVAVATTGVGMEEETLANARLIAAAPDLLEALQAMATEFDSGDVNDGEWAAIQKARTAIAKATGEKQ